MTIDERAAACAGEALASLAATNRTLMNLESVDADFDRRSVTIEKSGLDTSAVVPIIARHLREAVAERDALLRECLRWLRHCNVGDSCQEQIIAMIGEQA